MLWLRYFQAEIALLTLEKERNSVDECSRSCRVPFSRGTLGAGPLTGCRASTFECWAGGRGQSKLHFDIAGVDLVLCSVRVDVVLC